MWIGSDENDATTFYPNPSPPFGCIIPNFMYSLLTYLVSIHFGPSCRFGNMLCHSLPTS